MKILFFQSTLLLLLLLCMNTCSAMDQTPQEVEQSTTFIQIQADIPLGRDKTPCIKKKVNIQIPSALVKAPQDPTLNKPVDNADKITLNDYIKQQTPGLLNILGVFVSLMQNTSTGQTLPQLGPMANYDATLFGLLRAPQTSFFYLCGGKRLILDWPLGEHNDGWCFNHSLEIQAVPEHPRKGTRSEAVLEFHNTTKNIHFLVPLATLQEHYTKAGKQTIINAKTLMNLTKTMSEAEFAKLHQADMIAIALHYVSNPANIKTHMTKTPESK